jgi:hypothetical protein
MSPYDMRARSDPPRWCSLEVGGGGGVAASRRLADSTAIPGCWAGHVAGMGLIDWLSALAISDPLSPLHEAEPELLAARGGGSSTATAAQTRSARSSDDGS